MTNPDHIDLITFSIVSHEHGDMIADLLGDISLFKRSDIAVILTINTPEDESYLGLTGHQNLIIIRNDSPKGYGANHNAAFRASLSSYFVVLNPDIRIPVFDLDKMISRLSGPNVGLCVPFVLSETGEVQDSFRRFPNPFRLIARHLLRLKKLDYGQPKSPQEVDWVGGMFMAFKSVVYARIGGFDEEYFMYMEDVDLCWRLKKHGYKVMIDPEQSVYHFARRASRKNIQHVKWHISSMMKFFWRTKFMA
jgi:N-acetylglucosaminyl-diphospho-decaprenol L-rhamnosyltransferase